MAEPQASPQTEKSRQRGENSSGSAEPRTFDDIQRTLKADATPAEPVQPAIETGKRIAETGRQAGRQLTEAWRLAFDPLLTMQFDFARLFDETWRQTFGFRQQPAVHSIRPMGLLSAGLFGLPPSDLKETKGALELDIELPGLKPEDVDVSLDGESLVVCGHKMEENTDASAAYRMSERRYGRFERVFPLPADIDRGRIAAQFRDGVLKITLPKDPGAASSRSRIEIRT